MKLAALVLLVACLITPAHALDAPSWLGWRERFLADDGRVIDTGQGGVSTSEGQGYGMLLAAAAGDAASFARMWGWTRRHLAIRADGLLAWRYHPQRGVEDDNAASDGDLLVAWALARAAVRFQREDYRDDARALAVAIRRHLIAETLWGPVLKAAPTGFERGDGQVINLSYWVFPAFTELARIDPDPAWQRLEASGLHLLRLARFGRWGLPPDWLLLVDPLRPDPARPARFGYDALRIPLYLVWSGKAPPDLLEPFRDFWRTWVCTRQLPAWTDFDQDAVDAGGGFAAVHAIARLVGVAAAPPDTPPADYYPATLVLLARLAAEEGQR